MEKSRNQTKKALFLAENGFCEREFIQANEALTEMGVNCYLASSDVQLIKGWNQEKDKNASDWGQGYAPYLKMSDCLASDFDILVLPGGQRSIEKLKLFDNLRTLLAAFVTTKKPVVAYNYAIDLLNFTHLINGYTVATKDNLCSAVKKASGRCAADEFVVSKNLITMSRYRTESKEKLKDALDAVMQGKAYSGKTVSERDLPISHKAA